jgi:dimethylsulfone monooxygenase
MSSFITSGAAEDRSHLSLYDDRNKLKLGTFATNVSNNLTISEAPTSYELSWEHTLKLARLAEDMGLDMLLPLGRWRGFGGATDFNGESFETYNWAAGLAQATERVMIFATSHVPVIHPIVAAKQAATIDHISGGRFGLNLVMGWFTPEMEMFGAPISEHDERYRLGEEWIAIVRSLWTLDDPFSFDGDFFRVTNAISRPHPIQQPHPVIMNAGASPAGSDFSARNADISFVSIDDIDAAAQMVRQFKNTAHEKYQRTPEVYSGAYIICRDTEAEAQQALREILDKGDREAVRNLMSVLGIQSGSFEALIAQAAEDRFITGWGAPVFLGTPEQITERLAAVSAAGISGMTLGFNDPENELAYFDKTVMPLLREAGLRA